MDLYGLIHARFILSSRGLQIMKSKFTSGVFGACPRVLCDRQHVLPVGMSEDLSISRVKVRILNNPPGILSTL
jgi:casein kinase II subunit beta